MDTANTESSFHNEWRLLLLKVLLCRECGPAWNGTRRFDSISNRSIRRTLLAASALIFHPTMVGFRARVFACLTLRPGRCSPAVKFPRLRRAFAGFREPPLVTRRRRNRQWQAPAGSAESPPTARFRPDAVAMRCQPTRVESSRRKSIAMRPTPPIYSLRHPIDCNTITMYYAKIKPCDTCFSESSTGPPRPCSV